MWIARRLLDWIHPTLGSEDSSITIDRLKRIPAMGDGSIFHHWRPSKGPVSRFIAEWLRDGREVDERVYDHLGEVHHRAKAVESEADQHADQLAERVTSIRTK